LSTRVLLTGGAGFIGSACLVELCRRGEEVVVLDAFETTLYGEIEKRANLAWAREHGDFELAEVDVRDPKGLARVLGRRPAFDLVIHLAAVAGVRPSLDLAPHYLDVNVTGTARLLGAARAAGCDRMVLASSSSVYGNACQPPFREDDPGISPESPYAASKLAMELLARTDQRLHGGDLTCLRFFTVYGPRQRPDMAFRKFMSRLVEGRPVPVFGDGSTERDYTYLDDIVAGVMAAADRLSGFRVYNLGGDHPVRLDSALATLAQVVGRPIPIERLGVPPGDVRATSADLGQARRELGFEPRIGLEDGLRRMWSWFRESVATTSGT
jgi:UDP-glucuronate 4-epimerase